VSIDITQFYQIFFEEAAEQLATMESLLLSLDVADPSMNDLNAIFRSAHSIKGGAGTFGFNDMTQVTHILESLLDRLRKQELKLSNEMVNVFLEAGDVIRMQLDAHRGAGVVEQARIAAVCGKLERWSGAQPHPAANANPVAHTPTQAYGFFDDEARDAAPADADPGYGFFEDIVAPQSDAVVNDIKPSFSPAGVVTDAEGARDRHAGDKAAGHADHASIRVHVEKVDQLINLVGELVITQSMLTESAADLDSGLHERLLSGLRQLERNTRDLQEAILSVRMLPISFVFNRFPRVVRDLAGKLGKQVELKTLGEDTELDKGLIEKIADPLTHLVRNSLDHGIESPDVRRAAGKPENGTITLKASHQGGNIVIEVADDGGGLNRGKILAKARERGLPVRDDMGDAEVWMLIFEAGFSTAEVITDVSGRGVGMDVVKRNISAMGGRVEIESAQGLGTRILIHLPLTLAILDGLSVAVGQQTYIIPLGYIVESLLMAEGDLRTVSGGGHMVHVRGEYLPLLPLHEVFDVPDISIKNEARIVVIVATEGKRLALLVDELLGQHQVVIKSLESNFRKLPGISGATIMGDGKVALILDVAALSCAPTRNNKLAA
jgi:two-component system chemotaxis sensor kinase CheA